MARARPVYLDLIATDRAAMRDHTASAGRKGGRVAPHVGKKRAAQIGKAATRRVNRSLAKHYERCKRARSVVGRFGKNTSRSKSYCAAIAWTIAKRKEAKRMKLRRGKGGRFLPKSRSRRHRRAGEPSRKQIAAARRNIKKAQAAVRRRHRRPGTTSPAIARAPKRRRKRGKGSRMHRPMHPVKAYSYPRKARRIAYSQSARTIRVPQHMSHELMMMAGRRHRRRGYSYKRRMMARMPAISSGAGFVLLGLGGIFGFETTDFVDRILATKSAKADASTLPQGISSVDDYNALAVAGAPKWARVGMGVGFTILGVLAGAFTPWGWLKMLLYGFGVGSGLNIGTKVIDGYVIEPLANKGPFGQRLYQHELVARTMLHPAAGTTSGPPDDYGIPIVASALPEGQPQRMPPALMQGGQLGAAFAFAQPPPSASDYASVPTLGSRSMGVRPGAYVPPSVGPGAPVGGGDPTLVYQQTATQGSRARLVGGAGMGGGGSEGGGGPYPPGVQGEGTPPPAAAPVATPVASSGNPAQPPITFGYAPPSAAPPSAAPPGYSNGAPSNGMAPPSYGNGGAPSYGRPGCGCPRNCTCARCTSGARMGAPPDDAHPMFRSMLQPRLRRVA